MALGASLLRPACRPGDSQRLAALRVLDITAACLPGMDTGGATPADVLKGVASALWGRAALDGGAGMAMIGLVMHFTVALTATLVFYALSRRFAFLRTAPLLSSARSTVWSSSAP
jgi:hypothetical protein